MSDKVKEALEMIYDRAQGELEDAQTFEELVKALQSIRDTAKKALREYPA